MALKEIIADIWDLWEAGGTIVIPTNGTLKKNADAVMGAGLAKQAALRFPNLTKDMGAYILEYGNHVRPIGYNMFSFPVKHNWWEKADLDLIDRSARELNVWRNFDVAGITFLPWVGCGNGALTIQEVRPILETNLLSSKFIIVTLWEDWFKEHGDDQP